MRANAPWLEPFTWDFVVAQNEFCAAKNPPTMVRHLMATLML